MSSIEFLTLSLPRRLGRYWRPLMRERRNFAVQTPATQEQTASKTLFFRNLSYNVEQADVENFIKDAGEIVDFWFTSDVDGRFKRFGQIELATGEAAQKKLQNQCLAIL
uniref:RRM domain-containing protein n=1 Tax=Quercus lobata TaxID=97700 RepID=A0A7N2L7H6_QUELO